MKITTFNPMIVTNRPDEVLKFFEQWGFTKKHAPTMKAASGDEFIDYRLQSEEGFYMDVAAVNKPLPAEVTAIRINVEDFDEAYNWLTSVGFFSHDGVFETEHVKGAMMSGPVGFSIFLLQHLK